MASIDEGAGVGGPQQPTSGGTPPEEGAPPPAPAAQPPLTQPPVTQPAVTQPAAGPAYIAPEGAAGANPPAGLQPPGPGVGAPPGFAYGPPPGAGYGPGASAGGWGWPPSWSLPWALTGPLAPQGVPTAPGVPPVAPSGQPQVAMPAAPTVEAGAAAPAAAAAAGPGGPGSVPPWGWGPYPPGVAAPPPSPAPGKPSRLRAPLAIVAGVAVAVLACLGVGVVIGYGVWGTSSAPAASVGPLGHLPYRVQVPPSTSIRGGFLGVEVTAGSTPSGARVVYVMPTSPAANAGIASGDTITAVDSTSVGSPGALRRAVESHTPGQKVTITWAASTGKKHTATVTLAKPPSGN